MSVVTIGRLALGPPGASATEGIGDAVGTTGSAVVAAPRTAQTVGFDLNTIITAGDSLATAQSTRRRLRSLLNNGPMKMQAFLYLVYSDDTEQNGWLIPQPAQLTSPDGTAWKAVGLWQTVGATWYLAGRRRGMREARSIWMKDLRTGQFERDYLGWLVGRAGESNIPFMVLPALPLTVLPHGATQIENTVNGMVATSVPLPAGRDGGICRLVAGPLQVLTSGTDLLNPDLAALSFERIEAALNFSDVIMYDRRGYLTAPPTGPDTPWEEFYGSDYPYSWLDSGLGDVPVLDNGQVRVRYDSTNIPGFAVDIWNGTAYVEQGKMVVRRLGDTNNYCDTWVSSMAEEWTPDRATVGVVMAASADAVSRERVFITLDRGSQGVTFEVYPAPKVGGTPSDVILQWTPALNSGVGDLNNTVMKIDSQGSGGWTPGAAGTAKIASTAGTGGGPGNSAQFNGAFTILGNTNFTSSENWAAVLRYPTTFNVIGFYQATLVVTQAMNAYLRYAGVSVMAALAVA